MTAEAYQTATHAAAAGTCGGDGAGGGAGGNSSVAAPGGDERYVTGGSGRNPQTTAAAAAAGMRCEQPMAAQAPQLRLPSGRLAAVRVRRASGPPGAPGASGLLSSTQPCTTGLQHGGPPGDVMTPDNSCVELSRELEAAAATAAVSWPAQALAAAAAATAAAAAPSGSSPRAAAAAAKQYDQLVKMQQQLLTLHQQQLLAAALRSRQKRRHSVGVAQEYSGMAGVMQPFCEAEEWAGVRLCEKE